MLTYAKVSLLKIEFCRLDTRGKEMSWLSLQLKPVISLLQSRVARVNAEKVNKWIEVQGLGRATDPKYVLSVHLAFNVFARLLIYERHVGELRNSLTLLDIADSEKDVLQSSALKPYVLDEISDEILEDSIRDEIFRRVTTIAKRYSYADAVNDELGKAFEELIPNAERRKLGQFFTPIPIADLMVEYIRRNVERGRIVDPAVGTGRFILRLMLKSGISKDYRITGIDVSPLMILLTATNISYVSDLKRLELIVGDMFDLDDAIKESDAIICNPPYSRHHELEPDYKRKLQEKVKAASDVTLSRYSSFFAYALLYLSSLLKKGGYVSYICPLEIFEANYSDVVKRYVAEHNLLERVIVFDEDSFIFPYAENAATVIFLHKDSPTKVYFVRVKTIEASSLEKLLEAVEEGDFGWCSTKIVDISELLNTSNWSLYYVKRAIPIIEEVIHHPLVVSFKHIARIMRGIATGANDFFLLNDEEVKRWGIEEEFLRPALVKTRWVLNYVYDREAFNRLRNANEKCWLFYCQVPPALLKGKNAYKYVSYGERLGLPNRSLIRLRRIWYQVEKREPPPIVFTYLSRGRPRFIHNEVGALPLNTFLCIYPLPEISKDEVLLRALLAYLNSNIALELLKIVGRRYGGSTLKLEPRELDELPVLDVRKLSREEAEHLARLFDELKYATRGDEELKSKIDNAILSILRRYSAVQPKRTLVDYMKNMRVGTASLVNVL